MYFLVVLDHVLFRIGEFGNTNNACAGDGVWLGHAHCVSSHTVLGIIKLTKFPVPVRLYCGSGKLKSCRFFTMFCDISKHCTYFIAGWDAGLLGVSAGSKLCATFLNIAKRFKNGSLRLRFGCGYFFNLIKFNTVPGTQAGRRFQPSIVHLICGGPKRRTYPASQVT